MKVKITAQNIANQLNLDIERNKVVEQHTSFTNVVSFRDNFKDYAVIQSKEELPFINVLVRTGSSGIRWSYVSLEPSRGAKVAKRFLNKMLK